MYDVIMVASICLSVIVYQAVEEDSVSLIHNIHTLALEICAPFERVTLPVSSEPPSPYLRSIIRDMEVLSPFPPFFLEILRILNVIPPNLFPIVWAISDAFEMVCKEMDITLTKWVFFSTNQLKAKWVFFFSTNQLKGG